MKQTATKQAPPKQLNIRLPEPLHRELKAQCALDGIPLAGWVEIMAREYVEGKVRLPTMR